MHCVLLPWTVHFTGAACCCSCCCCLRIEPFARVRTLKTANSVQTIDSERLLCVECIFLSLFCVFLSLSFSLSTSNAIDYRGIVQANIRRNDELVLHAVPTLLYISVYTGQWFLHSSPITSCGLSHGMLHRFEIAAAPQSCSHSSFWFLSPLFLSLSRPSFALYRFRLHQFVDILSIEIEIYQQIVRDIKTAHILEHSYINWRSNEMQINSPVLPVKINKN